MKFELQHVRYMPKALQPGILYVSCEFAAVAHLCPCGCGTKIRTPIGPTEWSLDEDTEGPTLFPSIGNWHLPCQSHYWIHKGNVEWAERWTAARIAAGRRAEEARRNAYYGAPQPPPTSIGERFRRWLSGLLRK